MTKFIPQAPHDLIYLAMSFIEPRAVQVACQLKLFTSIAHGICTDEALANCVQGSTKAIHRVLLVCASLGLVYEEQGCWHLMPLANRYLVEGKEEYLGPVFIMSGRSFHSFDQLQTYVSSGEPIAPPPQHQGDVAVRAFVANSWAMGRVQADYAVEALQNWNFGEKQGILDIGAGSGVYASSFLKRFPELHYWALDLSHVVSVARELPHEKDITWLEGDIFAIGLPDVAFDIVLLASFIHGFSQQQTDGLITSIYQALPTNGLLLIQDHFIHSDPGNPGMATLFNLNIALHNKHGEVQTLQEIEKRLYSIGFRTVVIADPITKPGLMPVIACVK